MSKHKDQSLKPWIGELRSFETRFPQRLQRSMDEVMGVLAENLRESMPVRTGSLKASGDWDSDLSATEYSAAVTFGGIAAPYAPYVIGRFVDGHHPWDDVLPEHEAIFESAIYEALSADDD